MSRVNRRGLPTPDEQDSAMTDSANDRHVARQPQRLTFLRLLKSFRRQQDGTTAIEFAMVGVPFFMLLFAIIETAMIITGA
jgi:Flp pilus assembly protein TadG